MKNNFSVLYLTGFMGSGKSTIGKILAKKANLAFFDLDEIIEAEAKCSISDIFKFKGEAYFRSLESAILKTISLNKNVVIALGGGTLLNDANLQLVLASGTLIYLTADLPTLQKRLDSSVTRPLLKDQSLEQVTALYEKRTTSYIKAHFQIDTNNKSKEEIANLIMSLNCISNVTHEMAPSLMVDL